MDALHTAQDLVEEVLHVVLRELIVTHDNFVEISLQQVRHNVNIFEGIAISRNQDINYFQNLLIRTVSLKRRIHYRAQSIARV